MSEENKAEKEARTEVIYIGIDAHLEKYVIVRQLDGLSPQPAQTFRKERNPPQLGRQTAEAVPVRGLLL